MAQKKLRWRYFIDKPFQIRFIARFLVLILVGLGISVGILAYANSKRFDQPIYFQAKNLQKDASGNLDFDYEAPISKIVDMRPVNIFQLQSGPMIWLSAVYLTLIIVFGLFISHKMAGPIYRIKKTLKEITEGKISVEEARFSLRKRDELKDLVDTLNEFLEKTAK